MVLIYYIISFHFPHLTQLLSTSSSYPLLQEQKDILYLYLYFYIFNIYNPNIRCPKYYYIFLSTIKGFSWLIKIILLSSLLKHVPYGVNIFKSCALSINIYPLRDQWEVNIYILPNQSSLLLQVFDTVSIKKKANYEWISHRAHEQPNSYRDAHHVILVADSVDANWYLNLSKALFSAAWQAPSNS